METEHTSNSDNAYVNVINTAKLKKNWSQNDGHPDTSMFLLWGYYELHNGSHLHQTHVTSDLKLEADDIIEKVTGPTPWVSTLVTLPKHKDPNKIWTCVDMRQANPVIEQKLHVTPTTDDVIHELNGSMVFSKLDLRAVYHQLELHPESRYITTFTTHLEVRKYKRLSFGISSAVKVFQNVIHQTLQGLRGVKNLSDDIIVYSTDQDDQD